MQRVVDAAARYEPLLRTVDATAVIDEHPEVGTGLSQVAVPVHPEIADALNLEWYDSNAVYQQYGGFKYTYEKYFSQVIRYSIGNRQKLRRGEAVAHQSIWQLPLNGPAFSADVSGYFPDGFMGKSLSFLATAENAITGFTVRGFCPAHHTETLAIDALLDDDPLTTIDVPAGTMFTLTCPAPLKVGQSVKIQLKSSAVMNLLARGESEDARDLSLLILGIDANVAHA
jgi:hypothetical protein